MVLVGPCSDWHGRFLSVKYRFCGVSTFKILILLTLSCLADVPQQGMGAIVGRAADISSLEKETIINTRANKLRDAYEKCPIKRNLRNRWSRASNEGSDAQDDDKLLCVGFGNIVHERLYFSQEAPCGPIAQETDIILRNIRNRRLCSPIPWCETNREEAGKFSKRRSRSDREGMAIWKVRSSSRTSLREAQCLELGSGQKY